MEKDLRELRLFAIFNSVLEEKKVGHIDSYLGTDQESIDYNKKSDKEHIFKEIGLRGELGGVLR